MDVDVDTPFTLRDDAMLTRVGWTPFAGMSVVGRVQRHPARADGLRGRRGAGRAGERTGVVCVKRET
ncbi:MAG: hypothetical protein R2851_07165 [Caldilineaceae bacterium]